MLPRALLSLAAAFTLAAPLHAQDFAPRDGVQWLVPARPIVQPPGQAAVRISAAQAHIRILDRIATTELAITVTNPGPQRAEAQLLLPVPEGSAIRSFRLDALGEDSAAVLLPAAEARRVYDAIVRKIVDPGLLEFAGLGLIRSSVFPVEPGATQTFRVVYEQVLTGHDGRLDYTLPRTEALGLSGVEWTITAEVRSTATLGAILSPSHAIDVTRKGDTAAGVTVTSAADPGSLRLSIVSAAAPMSVIAYPDARVGNGQGGYFMLIAGAPQGWATQEQLKREVTLVIDRSGSMQGDKLAQAKDAALRVIAGLVEGETFNIIDYAGSIERFAERPQPRTAESLAAARAYIAALRAGGSTNLHDALIAALRQPAPDGSLPLVLFLTDGRATDGITSEVGIRDAAKAANAAHRRVFTFGVGFDVNAPLLSGLADATRAAPTFVLPEDNIEAKVSEVFARLDGPVLVNPQVTAVLPGVMPLERRPVVRDLQPASLPDLYRGDHLVVMGRYLTNEPIQFEFSGFVSPEAGAEGRLVQVTFDPAQASVAHSYVPRLWAQRRIGQLVNAIRQAGAQGRPPEQGLVDEIVALSTEHGILTEYTSFLAAEETQYAGMIDGVEASTVNADRARDDLARTSATREGKSAVASELNVQSQRMSGHVQQNAYADAAVPAAAGQSMGRRQINTVQRTGDRTLFQRGDARWVEAAALPREADTPDQTVEFGTDAYFALVTDLVTQNRQGLIAQRGEVLLLNHGQLVLVRNPA